MIEEQVTDERDIELSYEGFQNWDIGPYEVNVIDTDKDGLQMQFFLGEGVPVHSMPLPYNVSLAKAKFEAALWAGQQFNRWMLAARTQINEGF